jgi:predicted acetyltransferase
MAKLEAPPAVEVAPARADERAVLANLMQLYVHDFSEHKSGTPRGELRDDGRFPDYPLDAYWRDADRHPLLFRLDGRLIGFALVNAAGHTDAPLDRNMVEFFIVRKHRRGGAGTAAARAVFSRFPGRWEVAVARRNTAALPFWRQAIAGCPGASEIEEADLATAQWNGPMFRFRIAPP